MAGLEPAGWMIQVSAPAGRCQFRSHVGSGLRPDSLALQETDNGRAKAPQTVQPGDHRLIGMRERLGGAITSGPSTIAWGPGRIDVVARGVSGDVQHTWYSNGAWCGRDGKHGCYGGQPVPVLRMRIFDMSISSSPIPRTGGSKSALVPSRSRRGVRHRKHDGD